MTTWSKLLLVVLVLYAAHSIHLEESHDEFERKFCWKDSYGRGVGSLPSDCGNLDNVFLSCYEKCPKGYSRFMGDCYQGCPTGEGWRDDGAFCRLTEYGRGVGYAYWN